MNKNAIWMGIVIGIIVLAIVAVLFYPLFTPKKSTNNSLISNKEVPIVYSALNSMNSYSKQEGKSNADKVFVESGSLKIEDKELSHTSEGYYCGSVKAKNILYQKDYPSDPRMDGGWSSTTVLDCGNYYWIWVDADSGPEIYGPFDK